jgi:hypothetical protein
MNLLGPRPSREAHVAEREFEGGASNPARLLHQKQKENRPFRAVFFLFLVVLSVRD